MLAHLSIRALPELAVDTLTMPKAIKFLKSFYSPLQIATSSAPSSSSVIRPTAQVYKYPLLSLTSSDNSLLRSSSHHPVQCGPASIKLASYVSDLLHDTLYSGGFASGRARKRTSRFHHAMRQRLAQAGAGSKKREVPLTVGKSRHLAYWGLFRRERARYLLPGL